jgi:hypothetical protein
MAIPYCDARQVQNLLDKVCGKENWQDSYYDVDGVTYCKIGIKIAGEWRWKSDCGYNDQRDKNIAVKGESSDAFKRAAIKWGPGRFLYEMNPFTLTTSKKNESGDTRAQLYCVDNNGVKVDDWYITDYINGIRGTKKPIPAPNPEAKGTERSSANETLMIWLEKYDERRIIKALNWFGQTHEDHVQIDSKAYKQDGVTIGQAYYAEFCHLVKITKFDDSLIDMCLDGFGYKQLDEGGIAGALKDKKTERILDECILIAKQCAK